MADYIYLIGADGVRSAAHTIAEAASSIQQSVASFSDELRAHRQFMTEWLDRLEAILKENGPVRETENKS